MANARTVTLAWGKPKIEVRKIEEAPGEWLPFPTPIEGSTTLETTQGEKMEAPIEGGENEAVKYKKNTYKLTYRVRQVPEREDPIEDVDGIVDGEYSVRVTPENPDAIGVVIDRSTVNVQCTFDSSEGTVKTYSFDALLPTDESEQVKFQKIM